MTRKDYVAIADALRSSQIYEPTARHQWTKTRDRIADAFEQDNPRFDHDRFYTACEGK